MSDETKQEVLVRMLDGFNRHDLDAIMALFADDCVFESPRGADPWGRRFVGKAEVRDAAAQECDAIALFAVRGKHLAVIREEEGRLDFGSEALDVAQFSRKNT